MNQPDPFNLEDYGELPIRTVWHGTYFVSEDGYSAEVSVGCRRALYTRKGIEYLIIKLRARKQNTEVLEKLHQVLVLYNRRMSL